LETYGYFVAHAFESLYEFGCGTCLLRQLLQIVRKFRLEKKEYSDKDMTSEKNMQWKLCKCVYIVGVVKFYGFFMKCDAANFSHACGGASFIFFIYTYIFFIVFQLVSKSRTGKEMNYMPSGHTNPIPTPIPTAIYPKIQ